MGTLIEEYVPVSVCARAIRTCYNTHHRGTPEADIELVKRVGFLNKHHSVLRHLSILLTSEGNFRLFKGGIIHSKYIGWAGDHCRVSLGTLVQSGVPLENLDIIPDEYKELLTPLKKIVNTDRSPPPRGDGIMKVNILFISTKMETVVFEVQNFSRALLQELIRHESCPTIKSSRYTLKELLDEDWKEHLWSYFRKPEDLTLREPLEHTVEFLRKKMKAKVKVDELKDIVPEGLLTDGVFTMERKKFEHMVKLRSEKGVYKPFQDLVKLLKEKVLWKEKII